MDQLKASRRVIVNNPQGLHARPADQFARLAVQFDAQIQLVKNGVRVDGKSVLNLLTLAAVQGTELVLEAFGPDAETALEALAELVEKDFNDEENEITGQEQSS